MQRAAHPEADSLVGLNRCDWWEGMPNVPGNTQRRWTPLNGGMSPAQLDWLRTELAAADALGLQVGLFCHVLLHPDCSNNDTLLWNYEAVLEIIAGGGKPSGGGGSCVRAVFSGHQHEGGVHTDEQTGIHHCCFESPLLCKPEDPGAFALVEVRRDTIRVGGYAPVLTADQERTARGHVLVGGAGAGAAEMKQTTLKLRL
jgi:hypothetical protein